MKTIKFTIGSKKYGAGRPYPQATRGVCGRCRKAFLGSNQHG
jgi:hypothetical protein